jgi:hypothetical protein
MSAERALRLSHRSSTAAAAAEITVPMSTATFAPVVVVSSVNDNSVISSDTVKPIPALHGKCKCPLREFTMHLPDSDNLPEVVPPAPALRVKDGICFRQSITVCPPAFATGALRSSSGTRR